VIVYSVGDKIAKNPILDQAYLTALQYEHTCMDDEELFKKQKGYFVK